MAISETAKELEVMTVRNTVLVMIEMITAYYSLGQMCLLPRRQRLTMS